MLLQDVEYDAQRNAAFWETRPVLVVRRTAEIGEALPCSTAGMLPYCPVLFVHA